MIRLRYLLLISCITFVAASAQTAPQWLWTQGITTTGTNSCVAYGITNDNAGNVLVAAAMQGTVTVGTSTFVSRGANDILVVKYNALGSVLWARTGGGTSLDNANCVATDQAGNVYVAGIFTDQAVFGTDTLRTNNYSDLFIIKYDANGNQLWVRSAGGLSNEFVEDITVDAVGNLYVAGSFQLTATFGTQSITSSGGLDAFLVKYDSQGNVLWIRSGASTNVDQSNGVVCDASGNVYLTGYFSLTASFGSQQVVSSGGYDIFWAKYDSTGNLLLLRQAGGTGSDYGQSIAVDQQGHVFCTGFFNTSITVGSIVLIASGVDFYLAEYDPAGNVMWARSYGGTGLDNSYDIAINATHDLVISGYFENTLTLGSDVLTASGNRDIFLASFDDTGNPLWSKRAGGTYIDYSYSLCIDAADNIYMDGAFYGPSNFGADSLTATASGAFVSRLQSCEPIQTSSPQGFCASSGSSSLVFTASSTNAAYTYTWSPGGLVGSSITVVPTATTTYTAIATDPNGCTAMATTEAIVESLSSFQVVASPDTLCSGNLVDLFACWNWNNPAAAPTNYCVPNVGTTTADEQIYAVTIGPMINVQNENCLQNYTDYTGTVPPIPLNRGGTYPFSVTTDECDGAPYYNNGMSVFIDFNRDGDWDDAGELAYTTIATQLAPNIRKDTFSIPSSASIGRTRLRVVVSENTVHPVACSTLSYGEVEDYLVEIGSGGIVNTWSVPGQASSWITQQPSTTTTYTVTSTSQYGCVATASATVQWVPTPNVTVTAPVAACVSTTFTLDAGPGYAGYAWYHQGIPVGSGQSISDTMRYAPSTQEYVVQVTATNGCSAVDTLQVIASEQPDSLSICIVTVDSSSRYNEIIWEKSAVPDAVDSFLVYREITTNNYQQVGAVDRASLSVFTDTNVNVNATSYRYKIAWLDTCGNTGSLAYYHSTIHLQYLGLGNLQWTPYLVENNPSGIIAGYNVYRDDVSNGNFQLLQALSGTSYTFTDVDFANYPNGQYLVEVDNIAGALCNPTRTYSASRSNVRRINGTTSIADLDSEVTLTLFPTPTSGNITLDLHRITAISQYSIRLLDAGGRIMDVQTVDSERMSFDLSGFAAGLYIVQVIGREGQICTSARLIRQ